MLIFFLPLSPSLRGACKASDVAIQRLCRCRFNLSPFLPFTHSPLHLSFLSFIVHCRLAFLHFVTNYAVFSISLHLMIKFYFFSFCRLLYIIHCRLAAWEFFVSLTNISVFSVLLSLLLKLDFYKGFISPRNFRFIPFLTFYCISDKYFSFFCVLSSLSSLR